MKSSTLLRWRLVIPRCMTVALIFLFSVVVSSVGAAEKQFVYFQKSSNWTTVKVWAWNENENCTDSGAWPGDLMIEKDGKLYWEAPEGKVPTMIIFTNSEGTKAGGGDLEFQNGKTFKSDGTYFEGEDPVPEPEPEPTDLQYLYFKNSDNWSNVYLYAWGAGNSSTAPWPGTEMSTVSIDGETYHYWSYDGNIEVRNIIIHDNGSNRAGKTQENLNGDLPFTNGHTYYVDGSHNLGGGPVPGPSDKAGAVENVERRDNTLIVECEKATLFITPYSERIVKVFTLPKGIDAEERRSITVSATPEVDFTYTEENPRFVIIDIMGGDRITIDKESGLISFYDHESNLRLAEEKYLDNNSHSVQFQSMNDVAFYGGGYHKWGSIMNNRLRLNNTQTGNWSMTNIDYPHNICIPFVVSTSGYGVLFDDHYRDAQIFPSSNGLSYKSEAENPISYYYVGGDNLDEVIANYTHLTGRASLPPYWALGYITSRYGYHSENEANQVINNIRNVDIPLDGIVFDLYWEGQDESGMGNLDWESGNFPNPRQMLSDWKNQGIHTILITEPYFTDRCHNWPTLLEKGYLADEHVSGNNDMSWLRPNRDVGLLDCSNPEALDWMYTFYKARTDEGVDGWWLDLGEPEGYDNDSRHFAGNPRQIQNEFGQLWLGHISDCLKRDFPDMRHVLLPRAGTSGMQRHSAYPWTGDISRSWEGLQAQIPSLTNMAMSGVSTIGSDIGGFIANGYTNAELYLRWMQFGVFSPMLRTHSQYSPEPYNAVYNDVLDNVRNAINLRYRMIPYIYTLSYNNVEHGLPMARPAGAFDTSSVRLAENNDSYLWGRDLFVAPIVTSSTSRSITFPEGTWMDMNDVLKGSESPQIYTGGSQIMYNAPLDRIPFFLRRGAFLPMFAQESGFHNTQELSYDEINLYHYISEVEGIHEGTLYIDDRKSASSLEEGNYELVHFLEYNYDEDGAAGHGLSIISEIPEGSEFTASDRVYHLHLFGCGSQTGRNIFLELRPDEAPSTMRVLRAPQDNDNSVVLDEATGVQTHTLTLANSLDEARNAELHGSYYDEAKDMLYLKATVPAGHQSKVFLGDIPTGVEAFSSIKGVRLSYTDGFLNYSVGANYTDAEINIYSADGRMLATISGLEIDGCTHSTAIPAIEGLCIARISASAGDGNAAMQTCKFFAR